MTPLLRCDPRMGATTVSSMDGHIWRWARNIPSGFEPGFEPRLAHYSKCYTYHGLAHSLLDVTTLSSATTCPVLHWDAGTRRNRWCAGLAKIATRRRGLQVLFDDRFDKIGHFTESEVNEGTKGTFWRFE